MARHYGIPYMGSKQKLVDKIVPFILNRHPDTSDFYDLFGGGGSVSLYAARKYPNIKVHYGELSTAVGGLMQRLKDGGDIPMEFIRKDEFDRLKYSTDWYGGYLQSCWAFGNNTKSYLYGVDIQDFKQALHNMVVKGERNIPLLNKLIDDYAKAHGIDYSANVFMNFDRYKTPYQRRTAFARQITHPELGHIKLLQHMPYLERLVQIENMPGISELQVTIGKSYEQIQISDNKPLVYCDPPYEGTAEYREGGFDSKKFYDWVMSRDYPVYISSYKISDQRLKLVKAINTRSLMSKDKSKGLYNYENLYWNGRDARQA